MGPSKKGLLKLWTFLAESPPAEPLNLGLSVAGTRGFEPEDYRLYLEAHGQL